MPIIKKVAAPAKTGIQPVYNYSRRLEPRFARMTKTDR